MNSYKQIYGYFHDHGVELIVHHSDSYAANLVPAMIEMGIDVWQGCVESNNVPELIKKYGDKITFMGAIDNKSVDFNGWTDENCKKQLYRTIEACGDKHFYPVHYTGQPGFVYPGVYMSLADALDEYNAEHYGLDLEGIKNASFAPSDYVLSERSAASGKRIPTEAVHELKNSGSPGICQDCTYFTRAAGGETLNFRETTCGKRRLAAFRI